MPKANDESTRSSKEFSSLFECEVPESVKGFECVDREKMAKYWPAGTATAKKVRDASIARTSKHNTDIIFLDARQILTYKG